MSTRYYRPTIVLQPAAERAVADRAHAEGKGVQDFLRDAVLDALGTPAPARQLTTIHAGDVITSLELLAKKLTAVQTELQELLDRTRETTDANYHHASLLADADRINSASERHLASPGENTEE